MELPRLSHEEEDGRGQLCIRRPLGGEHSSLSHCPCGTSWDPGEDQHLLWDSKGRFQPHSLQICQKRVGVTSSKAVTGPSPWEGHTPAATPYVDKCSFPRDQVAPPNHDLSGDHMSPGPLVLSPGSFSKIQRLGPISGNFGLDEWGERWGSTSWVSKFLW